MYVAMEACWVKKVNNFRTRDCFRSKTIVAPFVSILSALVLSSVASHSKAQVFSFGHRWSRSLGMTNARVQEEGGGEGSRRVDTPLMLNGGYLGVRTNSGLTKETQT